MQPEWLANFGSMTTVPQSGGTNWFTWDSPTGAAYVQQAFATPSSYIMEATEKAVTNSGLEKKWPAASTTVQTFQNAWNLISALDPVAFGHTTCGTSLYADVGAVLYDDEQWAGTPTIEQDDPGYYVAMIAYYVHLHNITDTSQPLQFFVAPSFDLANAITPNHGGAMGYLNDRVPELVSTPSTIWYPGQYGTAGTYGTFGTYVPDDVDIQAQQNETALTSPSPTYPSLVKTAASQIHIYDANATLFAGLTTNNMGGTGEKATVAELKAAAQSVRNTVAGFWLNDSAKATTCPHCTGPYPGIADGSLNTIDTSPTW